VLADVTRLFYQLVIQFILVRSFPPRRQTHQPDCSQRQEKSR
jgi:hypothetical protein